MIPVSMSEQASRLTAAGYPKDGLVSGAESLLRKCKTSHSEQSTERKKTAVIPYMHGISHRLKGIANKLSVRLIFSAPEKLSRLCKLIDTFSKQSKGCKVKHRNKDVECS